jgi:hypothetical protein
VAEASQRFGIPVVWIRAVMRVESGDVVRAVSPKGALGLMQLMPQTWTVLRLRYGLGADPFDPHDNIVAGVGYMRELLDRFGAPGFLAAYNAGPSRYEEYVATGRPLPAETRAYLTLLARLLRGGAADEPAPLLAVRRGWANGPLFVGHASASAKISQAAVDPFSIDGTTGDWAALAPRSSRLFVATTGPK